ncbi:hypothetical protein DIPPA_00115 [Diplonema papillatum]|nr:hypothetical protein DIPPA_00115 [Diplonema papillatum]
MPSSVSSSTGRFPQQPRFIHEGQLWTYEGDIIDKMTDPSLYTGSHKHRFDEQGRGRGREGRDLGARGHGTTTAVGPQGEYLDVEASRWAGNLRRSFYNRGSSRTSTPTSRHTTPNSKRGRRALVQREASREPAVTGRAPSRGRAFRGGGSERSSMALSELDQDELRLSAIEVKLGITPSAAVLAVPHLEKQIELRWDAIRRHAANTQNHSPPRHFVRLNALDSRA